jgi:type I restriction enzyme S subunit
MSGFPARISYVPLKHVCRANAATLPEDTPEDLEIDYVDISAVDELGRISKPETTTFGKAPSRARRVIRSGDVLISTVRTYLRAIAHVPIADGNLICSTGFAVLTASPRAVPRFLFHWISSDTFVGEVVARSVGVSYPAINPGELMSLPFPLWPTSKQAAIATLLDRELSGIDALIAKKQRLIELLDEKRAILNGEAVVKGLDRAAPLKDSGVDWLGKVPVTWELKRLVQVAESIQTGPFGSQLHAEDYVDGGVPVINPSDLMDGAILGTEAATVSTGTAQRLARHRLREGDLVLARRGEIGRCGITTAIERNWLCGTGSARVRPAPGQILGEFLKMVFSLRGCKEQLKLASVGATMDNLNSRSIGRLIIPVPPLPDQQTIVDKCAQTDSYVGKLSGSIGAAIDLLREYRSALITAAVTGQLDIYEHEKRMEALAW